MREQVFALAPSVAKATMNTIKDPPAGQPQDETIRTVTELRTKLDEFAAQLGHKAVKTGSVRRDVLPQRLKAIIAARRRRESFFPDGFFADPVWDMLLELYYAEITQQKLAVSALCGKSAVPATTALRWINKLHEAGTIVRTDDHLDSRRVFIRLSEAAVTALDGYFESLDRDITAL